ncbi:MAG: hypothetical protein AAGF86_11380 [Pseudomonadota bacterium]
MSAPKAHETPTPDPPRADPPRSGHKRPQMRFDWRDWQPFLEAWEAPEARKREMIETLWVIVKTFADLRWEITEKATASPEETCGQVLDLRAALMAAVLRSEDQSKEESEEV